MAARRFAPPDPDDGDAWITVNLACAHKNRLVVFLSDGTALELADGSWSEDYEVAVAGGCGHDDIVESVILG